MTYFDFLGRLAHEVEARKEERKIDTYSSYLQPEEWAEVLAGLDDHDGEEVLERMAPIVSMAETHYEGILRCILDSGYQPRPVLDLRKRTPQKKEIYIFHDVHADGILPAFGLVRVNKRLGVPTTFYMNWGFSNRDEDYADAYRSLGRFAGDNVHLGLHAHPFCSWLQELFGWSWPTYRKWMVSPDCEKDMLNLLHRRFKGRTIAEAELETERKFFRIVSTFRKDFPSARSTNQHGNTLNRVFKKIANENPKGAQLGRKFRPNNCLTAERVKKAGRQLSLPERMRTLEMMGYFWESNNKEGYYTRLKEKLQADDPLFLLNHPANLENGRIKFY